MKVRMDELIQSFSTALDVVEGELFGVTTHHADRVAVVAAEIGKRLGLGGRELHGLIACALLHDNALTEYILAEQEGLQVELNMRLHCEYGQRNVDELSLDADVGQYILYHHERADGRGPFGRKEGEFPLAAEIISIADMIDLNSPLGRVDDAERIRGRALGLARGVYSAHTVDALADVLTSELFASIRDENICDTVKGVLPVWEGDVEGKAMMSIARFVARVIDYKSTFTRKHTSQIAARIWIMCEYYRFDSEKRAKLYLAAALHDIGKLYTPSEVLEKPGALDKDEYATIMKHVRHTYELLSGIDGFEDICQWASNHHEKLDGSGYPFGKTAERLDFPSRLMACVDIYQAVSEERPYHPRRSHEETMRVLSDMAEKGKIDMAIVRDLDAVMAQYSNRDIPEITDME